MNNGGKETRQGKGNAITHKYPWPLVGPDRNLPEWPGSVRLEGKLHIWKCLVGRSETSWSTPDCLSTRVTVPRVTLNFRPFHGAF